MINNYKIQLTFKALTKSLQHYLLISCSLISLSACTFGLPADEVLIKHFQLNRQDFEQLVETVQLLGDIEASSALGIAEPRRGELQESERHRYSQLLRKLEVLSASKDDQMGNIDAIYIEVSSGGSGLAFSSAEKGYAYLLEKPVNTLERPFRTAENLNTLNRQLSGGDKLVFHQIDDNWYLYFARHQN